MVPVAVIGTVLNERWRVDAKLADGGMSALWVASPVAGGKRVAVKVLSRELGDDPSIRQRFLRESQIVNSIDHPGVIPVIDGGHTSLGQPFMVMELLEGQTVQQRLEDAGGRLSYPEVMRIGDQMLDVLRVAHAKGVVHRDIKPENLFIDRSGRLRVLDFGLAKAMQLYGEGASTAVGTIIGTPDFMAPERAMGKVDLDARADLWAAGATLFKLASGQAVHEGATAIDVLMAAATNPARSLSSVAPDAPPSLIAAVDRALAFEPKGRWADASEMRAALSAGAPQWNDTTAAMPESPASQVPASRAPAYEAQDKTMMMARPEDVAAMRAAVAAHGAPPSQARPPYPSYAGDAYGPPSQGRPPMGSVPDGVGPMSQPRPPAAQGGGFAPSSDPRPPYGSWSGANPPASQQQYNQGPPPGVAVTAPARSRAGLVIGFSLVVVAAVAVGLVLARLL